MNRYNEKTNSRETENHQNMFKLVKKIPVIITIVAVFGILMHDMQIDRAATIAVAAAPLIAIASIAALDGSFTGSFHTHVDRAALPRINGAFRSSLPNIQPPRDDDQDYIQSKKVLFGGGDDKTPTYPM